MATWSELAHDNRSAAKELLDSGRYRSSYNRAYYAAYCAVASVLEGQVDFGYAGNNPTHDQLEPLILNNMYSLSKNDRYAIRKVVRQLRSIRVSADYVPTDPIGKESAAECLRNVGRVFRILGVSE